MTRRVVPFDREQRPEPEVPLLVRAGSVADYSAMSQWHYRSRRPAAIVRVLVAESIAPVPNQATCLGVLVVSMPVLNGRWRNLAWPGRYSTGDKRSDARRLNAEVRTISRVVIDPRARGLGVATRLVRAYLSDAITPATEAIAAMASFSSFFDAAGMTAYHLSPVHEHARFQDFLNSIGTNADDVLSHPMFQHRLARRQAVRAELERLRRAAGRKWFDDSLNHTQRLADACRRVCMPQTAYAYTAPDRRSAHPWRS